MKHDIEACSKHAMHTLQGGFVQPTFVSLIAANAKNPTIVSNSTFMTGIDHVPVGANLCGFG
jgi:hypothetical protein